MIMASSNIKLFDENKGNMLTDTEFNISSQRLNGLQTGVASSQLQNKAMYQASLVAYAIAQIMMQNGKNANDTDAVSAFVANLSGAMLQKVYDIATTEEAQAGVATGKWMSPALVKAAIDTLAAKAQNILSNETKALYGLPETAVPDDVFLALIIGVGNYGYRVKIQLADGTPVEGVTVSGITSITGSELVSGADGIVFGKSTSQTVTIGCTSPYIDQAAPANQSVTATETITDVTLTLTNITGMITVTNSTTAKVSPMAKTMDVTAVGGGGGGGGGIYYDTSSWSGGGGGGGGYVSTKMGLAPSPVIKIGSGGNGGYYGNRETGGSGGSGGTTTVTIDGEIVVSASGGRGGSSGNATTGAVGVGGRGNGNGGNGGPSDSAGVHPGTGGSGYIFDDSSVGLAGGGGGGGGRGSRDTANASGGKPYGGASGQSGTRGGGGGGGRGDNGYGGTGGSGVVYLRFHF